MNDRLFKKGIGRWLRIVFLLLVILAAGALFYWRQGGAAANGPSASLTTLPDRDGTAGFSRATEPGAIQFPRDLGSHDDFQTEWWYYTGNLETAGGRPFGFQLTFFRRALTPPDRLSPCANQDEAPDSCAGQSAWRTNQVYLAHFTISDIVDEAFYPSERFSRGAAGLAGAQASPYRVWLEDWAAEEIAPGTIRLQARSDEVALDLELKQTLPPILHGDRGLSAKGPEPGNASYYYSIVRQTAAGTVTVKEDTFPVTGLAWKDHEYSTSALSEGAIGWDWFSLQLDDGSALMLFEVRRDDGTLEAASGGTYIDADGKVEPLVLGDWQLEVLDKWRSPVSGADYPAGWRISIPKLTLELGGRPLMSGQELNVSTTYWEGAATFEGSRAGRPVTARGYIELTGYAKPMTGQL